jgi:hypothetical protein
MPEVSMASMGSIAAVVLSNLILVSSPLLAEAGSPFRADPAVTGSHLLLSPPPPLAAILASGEVVSTGANAPDEPPCRHGIVVHLGDMAGDYHLALLRYNLSEPQEPQCVNAAYSEVYTSLYNAPYIWEAEGQAERLAGRFLAPLYILPGTRFADCSDLSISMEREANRYQIEYRYRCVDAVTGTIDSGIVVITLVVAPRDVVLDYEWTIDGALRRQMSGMLFRLA